MLVKSIREVDLALGAKVKNIQHSEAPNRIIARKSIIAAKSIKKGEKFTEENITTKRPGSGVSPIYYWKYIGLESPRDYLIDELIEEVKR